eukprot:COSAG06_NODE_14459_length_1154_cov_40.144076_2_plen_138_part_00
MSSRRKTVTKYNWKKRGLQHNDIDALYDKYMNTTNCELCNVKLCMGSKGPNRKCMDHCHITGNFRNIICHKCNSGKIDNTLTKNTESGIRNIRQVNISSWRYLKIYNKKTFNFTNKNKQIVLWCKFVHLMGINRTSQ